MKLKDLYEADSLDYLRPGKTYLPHVNERGKVRGSVKDWLKIFGATDKDLATAYKRVLDSPDYSRIIALGFTDLSSDKEAKNGTIHFGADIEEHLGGHERHVKLTPLTYKVLANGKIDVESSHNDYRYDIATGEPTIREGDPVSSISITMRNSLKHLLKTLQKRIKDVKIRPVHK